MKIKIDHTRVSVLERARRHEPKTPGEIGILRENLQPSVVFVFPERADISECRFLHGSIRTRRRTGIPKSNRLARGGIHGDIPLEIANTVIAVQHIPRGCLRRETSNAGCGMHQRRAAVLPDN